MRRPHRIPLTGAAAVRLSAIAAQVARGGRSSRRAAKPSWPG